MTAESLAEELVFHVERGAALLAQGDAEGAALAFGRALRIDPRDERALALLGQASYKLGRYPEAAEAFGGVVDRNPAEPAARVNFGLASLKAGLHAQAVRQLEIALDFEPAHRKAQGYLALALQGLGEHARALELFRLLGAAGKAAECEEALEQAAEERAARAEVVAEAPVAESAPDPDPEPGPEPSALEGAPSAEPEASWAEGLLADLGPDQPESGANPFTLEGEHLTVRVQREVLVRQEGLLAIRGPVRLVPERKRYRGNPTQIPFGRGSRRVLRASGQGELSYRVASQRLVSLDLAAESLYLREESVFAFEDAIPFENGRVAAPGALELNLVHLRGPGRVVVTARGAVTGFHVRAGTPLRIPVDALLGFRGALTPRLAPLADGLGGAHLAAEALAIELSGVGEALLDEGAAA